MCERGNAARRRRHITGAACTPPAGQDRAAFWVMEATSLKRGVREGGSVFVNNYLLPARRLPGTFFVVFFLWFLDGEGGRRRMGRGDSAPWMDGSSSSTVASLSLGEAHPLHSEFWTCSFFFKSFFLSAFWTEEGQGRAPPAWMEEEVHPRHELFYLILLVPVKRPLKSSQSVVPLAHPQTFLHAASCHFAAVAAATFSVSRKPPPGQRA